MPHVLVADKIADAGLEVLATTESVTFDVQHGLSPTQLADVIGSYDGVLIRSAVTVTRDTLRKPGRLAAIARAGVGVDNIDLDAATQAGILVLNTPDANTISTAEHTMALILALHRNIPNAHIHVLDGQWKRSQFQGSQLAGRTLGIIGLGRIGQAVAHRALAFEMKVVAFDPFVSGETALDGEVQMAQTLGDLLQTADCVTLHAAVSDETRRMISRAQLAQMKPGAKLINCARGALIDETALADSLNAGHLGGAAIDVYDNEPPTDSPLLTAKNVVLTPHLAASTSEAQRQVSIEAAETLLAYLLRGEIRSAVNVSGLPKSVSPRARAHLDLCQRMGNVLSVWAKEGVERITVTVSGEPLEELASSLAWQATIGIVGPHLDARLNLVNVREQAAKRGIAVEHAMKTSATDHVNTITIELKSRSGIHTVQGTIFADRLPRIQAIDGYRMDIIAERSMVLIFNDDRPGAIGLVGRMVAEAGVNIADMALSRRGETALMVLKLDAPLPDGVREALRQQSPPIQSLYTVEMPPLPDEISR